GEANQHADAPHPLRLLATRNKRPRCCPSQKRDELAPSHCLPRGFRTRHRTGSKREFGRGSQCPLWVISGHMHCTSPCPLYPQYRHWLRISACPLWADIVAKVTAEKL